MNTLNDLKKFAADIIPADYAQDCQLLDAQKTFALGVDHVAGAILKLEGEPVGPDAMSMDEAVRDLFWAAASLAVAYNLDLNKIVDGALPEFQRRHRLQNDPVAAIMAAFGIEIDNPTRIG